MSIASKKTAKFRITKHGHHKIINKHKTFRKTPEWKLNNSRNACSIFDSQTWKYCR